MDDAVVDLTDSPPLASEQAAAFNARPADDAVILSSDDDPVRSRMSIPGVTALPTGYVLPPIHRPGVYEHGRPERITTLRDVLSTRNSRHRARSLLTRQQAGLQMQYGALPGVYDPHMLPHTGDEPVEAGVYYPIRARAILPGQRQQRRRRGRTNSNQQQQQRQQNERSVSRAGRETADGAIDVEDVEEGSVVDSGDSYDDEDIGEGEYMSATDDEDDDDAGAGGQPQRPGMQAGQAVVEYLIRRQETRRMVANGLRAGGTENGPGGRRPGFMFPFHPGMVPPLMRGSQGQFTPFDFFPGEDISSLLTYLEATTPAPATRPMAPPPPLKLSKTQAELAVQPDYTRAVPSANFRDWADPIAPDALEIVCIQCTTTLFDKEPVWAPTCGHILCNTCVEGITAASKACVACRKRTKKTSLVRLYL
ncbi:hypothetical protein H4R19_003483 [Coemansia spiralis]|nr:hypothetical protein H4R19_003483 [Coemansia spiralis]